MTIWLLPLSLGTLVVSECPLTQYSYLRSKPYEKWIGGFFVIIFGLFLIGSLSHYSTLILTSFLSLHHYSMNTRRWFNRPIIGHNQPIEPFDLILVIVLTYQLSQIIDNLKLASSYA